MPGDAAIYSETPWVRRDSLVNKRAFSLNIFPTGSGPAGTDPDIEHKARPGDEYAMAWADKNDFDMLESYRDEGYDFVTDEKWTLHATRFRWDGGKLCASNNLVLMYKPYGLYVSDRTEERDRLQARIDGTADEVHAAAEAAGVDSFETRHGQAIVTPKKRGK